METELYDFALEHFHFVQKKMFLPGKTTLQSYMYEKVRPK